MGYIFDIRICRKHGRCKSVWSTAKLGGLERFQGLIGFEFECLLVTALILSVRQDQRRCRGRIGKDEFLFLSSAWNIDGCMDDRIDAE